MLIAKMPDGEPEIYTAVQGEGPSMGRLVVFVRTSACNLQCNFCDTSYTWYFKSPGKKGLPIVHRYSKAVWKNDYTIEMTPEEVAKKIIEETGPHWKRVVFTGGEPLLHQRETMKVMEILRKEDHHWIAEVETNGTIKSNEKYRFMDQINCSPKLESSGNKKQSRERPEVIAQYLELWRESKIHCLSFKFVVHPEPDKLKEDLEEIKAWEIDNKVPRDLIYLMPEGITEERIKKGTDVVMGICREQGYQFCTRLHVLLYGNKRAV